MSDESAPEFDFIPEPTGFQRPTHAWRQRWSEMTAPPSFLCHHCRQILSTSRILLCPPSSHKKTDHEVFPHYESFNLLRDSALRGCHLCSLAWLSQSSSMPTVGDSWSPKLGIVQPSLGTVAFSSKCLALGPSLSFPRTSLFPSDPLSRSQSRYGRLICLP